ncbi:hypothetical protein T492DRAFT_878156, partial [Pavlovales sp. CCMP2436]
GATAAPARFKGDPARSGSIPGKHQAPLHTIGLTSGRGAAGIRVKRVIRELGAIPTLCKLLAAGEADTLLTTADGVRSGGSSGEKGTRLVYEAHDGS